MTRELTREDIRKSISRMPKGEMVDFSKMLDVAGRRVGADIPLTDDELWDWIDQNLRIQIPRVAVCEGHDAPFTFIADVFFDRIDSVLLMANRGGSKTFDVALIHYLNAKFKPGIEGFTFGATEAQGQRCYSHLGGFIRSTNDDEIETSLASKTTWKNGSNLEIVPGSIKAVNGPHPVVVHADEVELMDDAVFAESRNMAQSKNWRGRIYKAKDIITSSRKYASGAMQRLIDEINEAVRKGRKPPYKLMSWCIFECAAPVNNCQVANPDLPECDHCDCHNVVKGTWDDGSERSLSSVCDGRLARSRGWVLYDDIIKLFTQNTREMWEAQQECSRPSTAGLVVPRFKRERNVIRQFKVDPQNGPIYEGIDFGGTNPNAVVFAQHMKVEMVVKGYTDGTKTRIPEGSFVFFDEIYEADIPASKLADRIVSREGVWREASPGFRVSGRHPDPQGKQARLELRNHKPPVPTMWQATRDVKSHINAVNDLVSDNLFFIDLRCEMMLEEIEEWHFPKPRPGIIDDPDIPVNDFDHCMAAMRYLIANVLRAKMKGTPAPGYASSQTHTTANFVREAREQLAHRPRTHGQIPGLDLGGRGHYGP